MKAFKSFLSIKCAWSVRINSLKILLSTLYFHLRLKLNILCYLKHRKISQIHRTEVLMQNLLLCKFPWSGDMSTQHFFDTRFCRYFSATIFKIAELKKKKCFSFCFQYFRIASFLRITRWYSNSKGHTRSTFIVLQQTSHWLPRGWVRWPVSMDILSFGILCIYCLFDIR